MFLKPAGLMLLLTTLEQLSEKLVQFSYRFLQVTDLL
jgi:hypothetical protein